MADFCHISDRKPRRAPGAFTSSPHLVGQAEILYHMGEFRSLKLLKTHAQQDPGNQQPTSCAAKLETILYEGVSEFELVSHSHRAPGVQLPGKLSTGYAQNINIMRGVSEFHAPRSTNQGPRAVLRITRAQNRCFLPVNRASRCLKTI